MKLNISLNHSLKHGDVATSVTWTNSDEILSSGDDHQVLRWDLLTNETSVAIELPPDLYPITMKWPETSGGMKGKNDLLLITGSDGSIYLYGKGNRVEKNVQGHQGAIISASWSPNGSEILTTGEDGYLRIWSRAGMLRSVLAQHHMAVYCSCWSGDGRSVLYALDKNIFIRPVVAGSTTTEWKAHDGLILAIAWNSSSNLIVSGGEDCRYRVWYPDGRCVYTSPSLGYPVISVAWSPSGELFAVGGSNMIRLCDRYGWTHCVENPKFGSVYSLEWSPDGTQFGGATSEGHVFVANVILKSCVWKNMEAVLTGQNVVSVSEFKANTKDRLEFQERVIHMSMNFGYLVVVLPTQIYIYNVSNIPAHVVSDLKEPHSIYLTMQSKRNFILCGHTGITTRSYDGRQLAQIKWPGMQNEILNSRNMSLAEDMIALIDQSERKVIRIFDTNNGKLLAEERSTLDIIQVALAQNDMNGPTERQLAYIDKTLDLHLTLIKRQGKGEGSKRLGTATVSILWHTEAPILATIRDNKARIYYFPQILFVDQTLLPNTLQEREIGDLGPSPELTSYTDSLIRIRKADGTMICTTGSYFVPQLYHFVSSGNYGKARRLCRYVNDKTLWGVLAGLTMSKGELDTAEICFSEIGHFDKVEYLNATTLIPDEVIQKSQKELFIGGIPKGESILFKAGRISDAIDLNIQCMNWDRALELTLKHKEDVKNLFDKRQEYLEALNIEEFLPRFTELGNYLKEQEKKAPVKTQSKKKVTASVAAVVKKKESMEKAEEEKEVKGQEGEDIEHKVDDDELNFDE